MHARSVIESGTILPLKPFWGRNVLSWTQEPHRKMQPPPSRHPSPLPEPGILAELGPDTLGRVQRIGRISLGNIARGLELFGYIESSRRWLIEGKKRAGSADP
jgi:hypothetical protein